MHPLLNVNKYPHDNQYQQLILYRYSIDTSVDTRLTLNQFILVNSQLRVYWFLHTCQWVSNECRSIRMSRLITSRLLIKCWSRCWWSISEDVNQGHQLQQLSVVLYMWSYWSSCNSITNSIIHLGFSVTVVLSLQILIKILITFEIWGHSDLSLSFPFFFSNFWRDQYLQSSQRSNYLHLLVVVHLI